MSSTFGQRLKAGWKSLDIDSKLIWMMFKGSVPVAVSIAMIQSTAVAETYTSLCFLISIIAVVTVNIFPRAKLIQMTFLICLFTAFATGTSLLAVWSGLQARFHTDPEGLHKYNSSQSAITAVWLFVNIAMSNSIQARYPALLIPTILYNIFSIVQYTSCSRFTTWKQCWDLVYLTIRCYYTGIAISFVSGLVIYPVTCRSEIFEVQEKYIASLRHMLKGTISYLDKLQTAPTFPAFPTPNKDEAQQEQSEKKNHGAEMRQNMAQVRGLYIKMHQELAFAKREIAWGKLRAKDIGSVTDHFRRILMPLSGMAKIPDILQRIITGGGWLACDFESGSNDETEASPGLSQDEYETIWKNSIGALIEPAISIIEAIDDGLEHTGLQLEIIPRPGTKNWFDYMPGAKRTEQTDIEAEGEVIKPGDPKFARLLEEKLEEFTTRKTEALTAWASSKGLSADELERLQPLGEDMAAEPVAGGPRRDRQQLYLILYIEHMLYTTGLAVLDLVNHSDKIVAEGIMSKNRLIVPSLRRLRGWFYSIWDTRDSSIADDDRPSSKEEKRLLYGNSDRATSNIEHLPPRNWFERLGVHLRVFQEFLRGPEFSFGFRSACATLSCAIVAYLHPTQEIFTHYRLIWSVIIAAIGGNMSAGQSGSSYVLRTAGSFLALICCYIIWYIVDGKTAGVVVMMWLCSFFQMYFLIRYHQYFIAWLVTLITEVLSIGYELQVRKIGYAAATATGTYVFPPYYVAAMRVACVLWGTAASIFFTYLPYPITVKGLLRQDMAGIMQLLANYHAVVHATIKARLRGTEGDGNDKHSRGRILQHTRKAMFNKVMLLTSTCKTNVYLQKYEPGLGGRFPVDIFEDILSQLSELLDYISLLSYATQVWAADGPDKSYRQDSANRIWLEDLSKLIGPINPTEEKITSILLQLSSAVSNDQSLPPRMELPKPYQLSQRLRELDPDVLSIKHMQEKGYSAYAVMEIISSMITHNLDTLVISIKSLVGVINFNFDLGDIDMNGNGNWKGKHE